MTARRGQQLGGGVAAAAAWWRRSSDDGRGVRCREWERGGAGATMTMWGINPVIIVVVPISVPGGVASRQECAMSGSVVPTAIRATPANCRLSRQGKWCPTAAQSSKIK